MGKGKSVASDRVDSERIGDEAKEMVEEIIEWSRRNTGSSLRELEEKVGHLKEVMEKVIEAAVPSQEEYPPVEVDPCACGGERVSKGYREREVVTKWGSIKVKRAYFQCEECGEGFFSLDEGLEVMDGWSPWVMEESLWMSQAVCSYREAVEGMERLAGTGASKSTLHRWVDKYGGKLAEQRQKQGRSSGKAVEGGDSRAHSSSEA